MSELRERLMKTEEERDEAVRAMISMQSEKQTIPGSNQKPPQLVVPPPLDDADFCQSLTLPLPRTESLWRKHLKQILEWSVHPYDEDRVFVPFTAELLTIMTPERLRRGVKSVPHRQAASVRGLLEVLQARRRRRRRADSDAAPPPVRILVLGGSVAGGDKCNPVGAARLEQRRRACAWPHRLEFMLNRMLGADDVVNVTAAAVGGTNTESALTLLEYDLVPADVDIIINAYSTNDMHLHSLEKAQKDNMTLRDRMFDISERFIHRAIQRCRPSKRPPPLIIYFDDYVGNEHPVIRETAVASETIPWLANYYGILGVSYADVVRDIVYGDTRETWFSPDWFKPRPHHRFEFVRQVHPGMGMHIVSAWLLLYSLVDAALAYCATQLEPTVNVREGLAGNETDALPYTRPKMSMESFPPRLFPNTTLLDVSNEWAKAESSRTCRRSDRCIFSWVSRITSNCMWADQLNGTMNRHMVDNQGWEAVYHYYKLGFEAAAGLNSRFVLEFPDLKQPVSEIALMVMKSYGEKWAESKVRLQVAQRQAAAGGGGATTDAWKPVRITNPEIVGYHSKNTSEQYSSVSVFRKGPVGPSADLRLSVELVAGNHFKIMGMAVCSSS